MVIEPATTLPGSLEPLFNLAASLIKCEAGGDLMIKSNSNNISGWIVLDKQSGITSRQAVSKISKIFNLKKIGHGGTLDPLATGILPIALGEATKLISFIQSKKKKYSFTIKWGEATDTDDIQGKIIEKSSSRPNKEQIENALISFIGRIYQIPPNFSAIKINGERSYNLARKNILVNHKPRKHGKTKFGPSRFLHGFLDLLTVWFISRFARRPMHLFGSLGLVMILTGLIFAIYLGIDKLFLNPFGRLITERPEFFISLVTMIIGSQFFSMGFIGELMLKNAHKKPQYQVSKKINL